MSQLLKIARNVHDPPGDVSDAFLIELSTQHHQDKAASNKSSHDDFQDDQRLVVRSRSSDRGASIAVDITPEGILETLRSQPDIARLSLVLNTLRPGSKHCQGFNIYTPGPVQAQIIHVLVNTILPTFWSALDSHDVKSLVACLRCIAGIQAIITRLRLPLRSDAVTRAQGNGGDLTPFLSALDKVLAGDETVLRLWADITQADISNVSRELVWKELVNTVASGKIIAAVAQAEDIVKANEKHLSSTWLSKGPDYAAWLGRNIALLSYSDHPGKELSIGASKSAAQLFTKALSLGYPLPFVNAIVTLFLDYVLDRNARPELLQGVLGQLTTSSRRLFLEHVLRWLSTGSYESESESVEEGSLKASEETSGVAALLSTMAEQTSSSMSILISFMSDAPMLSSISLTVRRAAIAVILERAPDELEPLLVRLITQFGNQLFINHAPLVQQESLAQALLVVAGCLHKQSPMAVLLSARSSGHMRGVSSRLDSSNQRARWLGMVVGVALSSLTDKEGSRMSFGTDEMDTKEAKWYLYLVQISDKVGSLSQLRARLRSRTETVRLERKPASLSKTQEMPIINGKRTFGPLRPPALAQTKIIGERVTEVFDDAGDDADAALQPYAKPDSDPEDSDEDATLVNRNKSKAPVYIRDLMRMLRDDKDHDRFQLGIKHAATLIRRKSGFGSEVKDHAEELATILSNLHDPFDTEDFDELRLQALIAVLLTDVAALAPWLSRRAFSGDYSLSQRCIILSALGLGGRELAGLNEDHNLNPDLLQGKKPFPTKRLPSHLHAIYSPEDTSVRRLEAASKQTEHQMIRPLALSAADDATSHLNAVKVRTFSSRLEVERTRRRPAANGLAKVFAEAFFSPLVTRYQRDLAAYGAGSVFASAPLALVTFVKTLALLLHAAGPATPGLPDVTAVLWDLLLSLRTPAVADISVLEAVLFALLTLLEVNGDSKQRVAQETPRQLVETQQWVESVFERTGGGGLVTEGSDEETRVRTLAAGVLVRTREVVEAYQKLLIGNVPGLW